MKQNQPEATEIEMGGQVKLNSNRMIKKRRIKRRDLNRGFPICLILQELYGSCKTVFRAPPGVVPPPSDVLSLCRVLDRMEPEDLGLSKNLQFFNPLNEFNGNRRVTYTNIYKCNNFSLVLFFFPATAVIPLHNHPDMTVCSKLLIGKMHIKSYDLVESEDSEQPSRLRLARLIADTNLTAPCETRVLYPTTGGNIHEFTAITPCVVLDVLGPPYSKEDDRDCTYYRDLPYDENKDTEQVSSLEGDENSKYAWLEEIEMPEDSWMDGIQYLGPQIIESIW